VVRIKDMTFGPAPATLKVGDTIRWQNDDILQHTATAKTGRFDLVLPPGKSATVTLQQAGKVTVFCRYHPGMTLQLTIEPLTTGQ
jgi:plastocyanin